MRDVILAIRTDVGVVIASTKSGDDGTFRFQSLAPGNYRLALQPPRGHLLPAPEDTLRGVTIQSNQTTNVDVRLMPIKAVIDTIAPSAANASAAIDTVWLVDGAAVAVQVPNGAPAMQLEFRHDSPPPFVANGRTLHGQSVRLTMTSLTSAAGVPSPRLGVSGTVGAAEATNWEVTLLLPAPIENSGAFVEFFEEDMAVASLATMASTARAKVGSGVGGEPSRYLSMRIDPPVDEVATLRVTTAQSTPFANLPNPPCSEQATLVPYSRATTQGDEDREPLIMVHGMQLTHKDCEDYIDFDPEIDTFKDLLSEIWADAELRDRYDLYVFKYPAYAGITSAAEELEAEIAEKLPGGRFSIVAHSMGGLVVRQLLQGMQDRGETLDRVRLIVTLATPHMGTPIASINNWYNREAKACYNRYRMPRAGGFPRWSYYRLLSTLGVNSTSQGVQDLRPEVRAASGLPLFADKIITLGGTVETMNAAHRFVVDPPEANTIMDRLLEAGLIHFGCLLDSDPTSPHDATVPLWSAIPDEWQRLGMVSQQFSGLHHIAMTGDWTNRIGVGSENERLRAYISDLLRADAVGQPIDVISSSFALGDDHTCAIGSTRQLLCWGWNGHGQLGDGGRNSRATPGVVSGLVGVRAVAAGDEFTCALDSSGAAFCWGNHESGQLGDGTRTSRSRPTRVLTEQTFSSLATGSGHACGLREDGVAYCWGGNLWGAVGDGTDITRLTPAAVRGGHRFAALSAGAAHTCAITMTGAMYCWGNNFFGQLGNKAALREGYALTPIPVDGQHNFSALDASNDYTCGVAPTGEAYCWGNNAWSQLGRVGRSPAPPGIVETELAFASIATGFLRTCAMTTDGRTYCWGRIDNNMLESLAPVPVAGGQRFVALGIGSGLPTMCGRSQSGSIYCWGNNNFGQVGVASPTLVNAPLRVALP